MPLPNPLYRQLQSGFYVKIDGSGPFTYDASVDTFSLVGSGVGGGGSITIQEEGVTVGAAATVLNFVGAGVTAAGAGGTKTITIPGGGGGGNVSNSGTPTVGQVAEWLDATTVQGVSVTGTGNYVKATSPTLVTPALGTPSALTLTNATGLPIAGLTGLAAGIATWLATPSSANLAAAVTGETGSGALVFGTSPTLVTPDLGTPSALTLTNATGLPIAGLTGLGAGIATWLATPSSANLAAAVTGETGSGALVFGTGPTLSAPTITGLLTTSGAQLMTSAAMGALAVDVTAGVNTKSISADSTLTFSATPANDTWFSLLLTNTDTAPHTITIPSSWSMARQATVTSFVIGASSRVFLTWRKNASDYELLGETGYLNNFAATAAPAVTDDIADGYGAGSLWYNATANTLYVCESNSAGAAVWSLVTGAGGGSVATDTIWDAAGDLAIGSGADTAVRLARGTALQILQTNSGGTNIEWGAVTGTGSVVRATSATLVTPVLGTPTSGNLSNCTADGTDAVGFRNVPGNSQSAAYTAVLTDAGKSIDHPASDANARTFTIPSNASVAYPVGTCLSFSNMTSQVVTIAINTDTMYLAGAGTTGSRSLAQYGVATARKITSTAWIINGTGLT